LLQSREKNIARSIINSANRKKRQSHLQCKQASIFLAHRCINTNQNIVRVACFHVIIGTDHIGDQIRRHDGRRVELVDTRLIRIVMLGFDGLTDRGEIFIQFIKSSYHITQRSQMLWGSYANVENRLECRFIETREGSTCVSRLLKN
jgi:hypothetical protein